MTLTSNLNVSQENNAPLFFTTLNLKEEIMEDVSHLPYHEFPLLEMANDDNKLEFGKEFIESSLCRMKEKHDEVVLPEYPDSRYFLSEGGLESGMKSCTLVPTYDPTITPQKSTFEHIKPAPFKAEIVDDPEELLEKAIKVMKGEFPVIKEKANIAPFMIISFYLQKITQVDMEFISPQLVKEFGEQLYSFSKKMQADKSTEEYQQQVQTMLVKMIDSENEHMKNFRLYRHSDNRLDAEVEQFLNQDIQDNQKCPISQEAVKESLESHHFPKSNYLLPVHPPIPEVNNLLLYWEKNILPKINEFVKTSLKQL